jgi:hypothetical protein
MGRNQFSATALGAMLIIAGACGGGDDDGDDNPPAGGTSGSPGTSGAGAGGVSGGGASGSGGQAGGSVSGTSGGGMSGGGAGTTVAGMSGGGAGTTPVGPVDCSSRGGDPTGTCKDSASGTFAIKTEVDVWWAQETDAPIVDPGRGKITVYLMGKLSGVCGDKMGMGDIKGCGTVLPPFVSWVSCNAFSIEFPDAVWDQPSMPHFTTGGNTTGFEPGETLAINIATGLVGIDLMMENDPWPTPAQTGTFACMLGMPSASEPGKCFPDDDGDGKPGITIKMGKIGMAYPGGADCGLGPIMFRGAPLNAVNGLDPGSVRAETLYIGLRTRIGGMGKIGTDCKSGAGDGVVEYLDSRVFDCVLTDGTPCDAMGATFVDEQAPNYRILKKGEAPPTTPDYVLRSACECPGGCFRPEGNCPLDQTPSPGARSALVRLGGVDETFDCAAVRNAAYPAL